MRKSFILWMVLLCGCCRQLPAVIPDAPQQQPLAVVFDVDGTLTPRPVQMWDARRDAARAVRIFADKGYKIIYLTARVTLFQDNIPNWLKEKGFPDGSIHVTQTSADRRDPVHFKSRILRDYIAHGWQVAFAYGDSSSDFEAYAAAGIPKERVFALQREGAAFCQPGVWKACLNGWAEHIDTISK